MKRQTPQVRRPIGFLGALVVSILFFSTPHANGQCLELTSALRMPLGITDSNAGNLLISETGTRTSNTGRISIVERSGNRRTLLDGLPSAISDVNEPSGPAGLIMRGRTLYLAIGIGDGIQAGPFPGTALGNSNPSSQIFSSVLALEFSANTEQTTSGFTLTTSDQAALGDGNKVTLYDLSGNKLVIQVVANFPNFTPNPLPAFAQNVRGSNPFDVAVVDDQLYVTDGGQNMVRQIDLPTGSFTTLASFAPIPNTTGVGGPVIEAVPTGIRYAGGQLLVTLFRGVPFPPGVSQVLTVDPLTGAQSTFIGGRKNAIDVLPIKDGDDTDYLVLQHASAGLFFASPGQVLRFQTPTDAPTLVAGCLTRPTSMALDEKAGKLYVTELEGRLIVIPFP